MGFSIEECSPNDRFILHLACPRAVRDRSWPGTGFTCKKIRFCYSHIICILTREIAKPVARSLSFRIAETVVAADRPFPHFTTRVAIRKGGRWKGGNCEHPMGERNLPVPRVLRAVAGRAELGLKSRALCGATDSSSASLVSCCACFWVTANYIINLVC